MCPVTIIIIDFSQPNAG